MIDPWLALYLMALYYLACFVGFVCFVVLVMWVFSGCPDYGSTVERKP